MPSQAGYTTGWLRSLAGAEHGSLWRRIFGICRWRLIGPRRVWPRCAAPAFNLSCALIALLKDAASGMGRAWSVGWGRGSN
jgi:hypothetical protein